MRRPFWRRLLVHAACASVLLPSLVVQVHNARTYPHGRSLFDVKGHVEYIRYVASNWRTPLATEGWEMFQPPLYYFAAAGVYRLAGGRAAEPASLEAVQAFSAVSGLFTLGVAYLLLGLALPGRPVARALGLAFVAMLPMGLYMNPMITNETFAGAAIGLALLATCWVAARPAGRPLLAALAGTMAGLGLLAKYTGLFVCVAGALLLGLRALDRPRERRRWLALVAYAAAAFAVAGWLAVRNAQQFGDPFVGNWDARSGYHYEQPPGYRTLGFYARFGSVFTHVPTRSRFASLWDGQYGSAWTDSHHAFLSHKDPATPRLGAWLYWLALLPTAAMLAGFAQSVAGIWRRGWDHPRTVLAATTVLTLTGVIAFTLETPTHSTIKAFFCLSLIPALAVFAGKGLDGMRVRLGRWQWTLYANLAALYGLAVYTFWYRGG
jgi:4-amino-4-deoxy-L-arabinose transferase-like glycosyltransferase